MLSRSWSWLCLWLCHGGGVVCGGNNVCGVVQLEARRLQTLFALIEYCFLITVSNINLHFASCLVSKGKIRRKEEYKYFIKKFCAILENLLNTNEIYSWYDGVQIIFRLFKIYFKECILFRTKKFEEHTGEVSEYGFSIVRF